jgi:hypothetical protein
MSVGWCDQRVVEVLVKRDRDQGAVLPLLLSQSSCWLREAYEFQLVGYRVPSAFSSPAAKRKQTRQDAGLGVNRGSSPLFPNPAWPVSRSSAPAAHRDTGRKACMAGRIESSMRHRPAKQATPIYSTKNASGMSATGDRRFTLAVFAPGEWALPRAAPLLPLMLGQYRYCQPHR